ncbi:MAG: uroporphyrinogen decarboxylase [Burkholderiales bacterium]|nr:uroporphyrinogen decarboxylase [Burkholderiales bacterium]
MKPMTAWERVEAAVTGAPVDHPPIALWRHFPDDDQHIDKLVARSVAWQERWGFDLVKFMPSGTYGVEDWGAVTTFDGQANGARTVVKPAVQRTEDWQRVRELDVRRGSYGRQNEALRATAQALKGAVPILQTVFSPLTTARKLATDRLYADLRRTPEVVEAALRVITDVTIRFALDALAAGAHGVFLATQQGSWRLLDAAEFERFGKRYDLEILAALKGKARLNMLHAHGDDVMFDTLAGYPVEMLNWHDRTAEPDLRGALAHFPRLLVGGVNEYGALLRGDANGIASEIRDAIAQTGGRRLMLGPGCVVPIAVTDAAIEAAVRAARAPVAS